MKKETEMDDWKIIISQKYCPYRVPKFDICSIHPLDKQCSKLECQIQIKYD